MNNKGLSMQQLVVTYEREIQRLNGMLAKVADQQKDGHFMEDLTVAALVGFLAKPDLVFEKLGQEERVATTSPYPTARQFARAAIHQAEAVMIEISQLMMKADQESKTEKEEGEGAEHAEEPSSLIVPP